MSLLMPRKRFEKDWAFQFLDFCFLNAVFPLYDDPVPHPFGGGHLTPSADRNFWQ
jgi:hypothetical protein